MNGSLNSDTTLMTPRAERDSSPRFPAMSTLPSVSVLIPTRNERESVAALLERLEPALHQLDAEVLFIDDSDDGTAERIHDLVRAHRYGFPVRVIARAPDDRDGGLGSAVVRGLLEARFPWAVVMDADLQHPPEMIPTLLRQAHAVDADLVVASRYCAQGQSELTQGRHLVSKASTLAAQLAFPIRLRAVSDPMSGFFLVRRTAVPIASLRPTGFKVLLEVVVRSPRLRTIEVPFTLGRRALGVSKGSWREGLRFGEHLLRLRIGAPVRKQSRR